MSVTIHRSAPKISYDSIKQSLKAIWATTILKGSYLVILVPLHGVIPTEDATARSPARSLACLVLVPQVGHFCLITGYSIYNGTAGDFSGLIRFHEDISAWRRSGLQGVNYLANHLAPLYHYCISKKHQGRKYLYGITNGWFYQWKLLPWCSVNSCSPPMGRYSAYSTTLSALTFDMDSQTCHWWTTRVPLLPLLPAGPLASRSLKQQIPCIEAQCPSGCA